MGPYRSALVAPVDGWCAVTQGSLTWCARAVHGRYPLVSARNLHSDDESSQRGRSLDGESAGFFPRAVHGPSALVAGSKAPTFGGYVLGRETKVLAVTRHRAPPL